MNVQNFAHPNTCKRYVMHACLAERVCLQSIVCKNLFTKVRMCKILNVRANVKFVRCACRCGCGTFILQLCSQNVKFHTSLCMYNVFDACDAGLAAGVSVQLYAKICL